MLYVKRQTLCSKMEKRALLCAVFLVSISCIAGVDWVVYLCLSTVLILKLEVSSSIRVD